MDDTKILTLNQQKLIDEVGTFVKTELKDAEGGHDWSHIQRVYNNALHIAQGESVDIFIVALGALLHDVADSKFHNGDECVGPQMTRDFLFKKNLDPHVIDHVVMIIEHISFKGGNRKKSFSSPELQVIQDADRLDALGAIGIARAFNYGGFKNRKLYDPNIRPDLNMTPEQYKKSEAPTINHFYEKLLLLKQRMNTVTGRKIAEGRHEFMEEFLERFYKEWKGDY